MILKSNHSNVWNGAIVPKYYMLKKEGKDRKSMRQSRAHTLYPRPSESELCAWRWTLRGHLRNRVNGVATFSLVLLA